MSDPEVEPTPVGRRTAELAASLDAAAKDLERNGPVPAAEVCRTLQALYVEPGAERAA